MFIKNVTSTLYEETKNDYKFDYLVYSASFEDTEKAWNMEYTELIKRMMFKKFDNYVQWEIDEYIKRRGS